MTPARMAAIHAAAMRTGRAWTESEIDNLITAPGAVVVAQTDAFALGRVVLDEAELLTIAVAPSAQGRGLGCACLDAFHARTLAAGARSVFLEVAADNIVAHALYSHAGYAKVGCRADYYGPGRAALVLSLKLAT